MWRLCHLVLILFLFPLCSGEDPLQKVYLPSVSSLTFSKTGYTTSHTASRPQLQCINSTLCSNPRLVPSHVICYNNELGRLPPEWNCLATLNRGIQIVNWTVICEKWDDTVGYVVASSCFLSYTLAQATDPEALETEESGTWSWFLHKLRDALLVLVLVYVTAACLFPLALQPSSWMPLTSNVQRDYASTATV